MTKTRSTKRALALSALAIMLCVSMLVGSTFAWFTDSVTSTGNIIKSGDLDVEMFWADGKEDPAAENTAWQNAAAGAIFNYELWEPGYTVVRHVKIENVGSLGLKYQINIEANGEVSKLADVIDVYFVDPAVQVANRAALADQFKIGTLSDILAGMPSNASGKLLAGEEATITLALKMQETAGNEYKKLEIGSSFSVVLMATQLTHEEDSYDDQYDANATYPVNNAAELSEALAIAEDGDIIKFAQDIKGDIVAPQKADTGVIIDGAGNTFEGTLVVDGKSATLTTAGLTIQNVTFKATTADACIQLGDGTNATRYTCNVTIENCTFDAPDAVGVKSYTGGDKNLVIRSCTATANAHSLAQLKGIDGVLVENCTINSVRGINFNNSDNITVKGCTINVQKYAVRFGESNNSVVEKYAILNSTLTSANAEGDATIVFRAGALNAELTLANTTVGGATPYAGAAGVTIING